MLELPEAQVIAHQLNQTIKGQKITSVWVAQTPHKMAWYHGDPQQYPGLLIDKTIGESAGRGAMVVVQVENANLVFSDGVNLQFHAQGDLLPAKHQLLIKFSESSYLSAVVQMYGGIVCFTGGIYDNPYYKAAVEKPALLTPAFNKVYFNHLMNESDVQKLSLKAFLATEQRIPGLGNGVLQDILFNARLHPKKKIHTLTEDERENLYQAVKNTLLEMVSGGGRDTEKDLFGKAGRYITKLSKNTAAKPCLNCGNAIQKEAYMGGSVYYCAQCQKE